MLKDNLNSVKYKEILLNPEKCAIMKNNHNIVKNLKENMIDYIDRGKWGTFEFRIFHLFLNKIEPYNDKI